MAAHKAASAVTIAPISEKSALATWVDRYWKLATLLAIAVTGFIVYLQTKSSAERSENDHSWDRVLGVAREDPASRGLSGNPAELQGLADQIQGKQAGAWALYLAATSAAEDQEYEEAKKAVTQLKAQYPGHPLLNEKKVFVGSEAAQSPVDVLEARIDAQRAWRSAHATLFTNPDLPADAPRVKIHTDKGDVVVGLYAAEAPKHVENFLKLAREGYYNGTKFHRVVPGFVVQGGDPNTITGDPTTWGPGGPDYKVPREENTLRHITGVLAMAKKGSDTDSSGSQFYVTVAPAHNLDGKHVVFGKVIEGMNVIREIERSPIAANTADRPENPVVVQSMEVVGG